MRVKNKLTPYPILSSYSDDYIGASFSTAIKTECQFGEVIIDIEFMLDDAVLRQMVLDGKAIFAMHVECPSTSCRRKYQTADPAFRIRIPTSELNDKMEVCTFVVASEDIAAYTNPHFHPDYAGHTFRLEKGNILAVGGGKDIKIVKDNDDLENLPSIIKIQKKKDDRNGLISVDTDDSNYILIGVHETIIDDYCLLGKGKYKSTVLSLIMLPAIELVLLRMSQAEEENRDKKWFGVIEDLLEKNGILVEDLDINNKETSVLAVAQKIFGNPIERSFKELEAAS